MAMRQASGNRAQLLPMMDSAAALHLHDAFCILELEAKRKDCLKGQLLQRRGCNILLSCCVWIRCGCEPLCYC